MKLQAVHDGTAYATEGRTVYRESGPLSFEPVGRIPVPGSGTDALTERVTTRKPWKTAIERLVGTYQTTNLWVVSEAAMLATAGSTVFASRDGGRNWSVTHSLPPSSPPMGVLPTCLCVHDGDVYLGEYPLDEDATPRILRSDDAGWTWEPFLELPDVRHVHAVATDPYEGDLWVTTGDRDDESRILRVRGGEVETVGTGSQRWRAVELAFTADAILWGVDSAYATERTVNRLPRDRIPTGQPDPVATVDDPVYYAETVDVDGTEWVVLSTAVEVTVDRTAPTDYDTDPAGAVSVLAASGETRFTEWTRIARYPRRRVPVDHLPGTFPVPGANAYVLLSATPERGLLLNPINAAIGDGEIRDVPDASFPPAGE